MASIFAFSRLRQPETVLQDSASMRHVRKKVCVCDDNEEASCHAHWGEAILVQGVRQTVYSEGEP